ncbi:hypothetical protein D9758_013168 [Tetrapyrgos nigripes]|uniref:Uncharacterized protein n=1 Tax=Tetrapyrgos nigripes TaxID=182062 RepID=A0A8H5FKF8_9AGAR|nr:hypothetical protein D9758_013168 [Tetrapyrgos nigripes]
MLSPTTISAFSPVSPVWLLALVAVAAGAYRWFKRISIKHIPGPVDEATFGVVRNLPNLLQKQVGETEFRWQEKYGGIARFKGPLLEDRLFVCDPKALQYILQVSGYKWPKTRERRAASYLLVGNSITFVEGAQSLCLHGDVLLGAHICAHVSPAYECTVPYRPHCHAFEGHLYRGPALWDTAPQQS